MSHNRSAFILLLAACAAASLISGCSTEGDPAGSNTNSTSAGTFTGAVPDFQGPWADLFGRVYLSENTNDHQREVIADGVIQEAEYVELRNDFKQCLEDLGITVTLSADGGFSTTDLGKLDEAQVTNDAVPSCEKQTVGAVAFLYESIRRNPDNKDEYTIVVSCLQSRSIVGSTYTVAQYANDLQEQTGLQWNSQEVRDCVHDPLGILDDSLAPGQ
ncbi:hypothetical protein ESZ53_12490 [Salinibacterium sp. UTAS2018]|uniref:hypothetical protein n=1 Tax=Salinibacterium sp. UTAS2018 TaxID=2508880 RepID=UPI001009400D|nr:hypothetical protein [Salinibacterium sp. UTAS2018]QAV71186.1 hypothetical protein ESZ53_12490 [Salinibacterium sp. UTAS2018]